MPGKIPEFYKEVLEFVLLLFAGWGGVTLKINKINFV